VENTYFIFYYYVGHMRLYFLKKMHDKVRACFLGNYKIINWFKIQVEIIVVKPLDREKNVLNQRIYDEVLYLRFFIEAT
jgi:hypothetical protein